MFHGNVADFLHDEKRKLTKTEWLTVLEARKNSLLDHFTELGQIKLCDVWYWGYADPMMGNKLIHGDVVTNVTSEDLKSLNLSTRGVYVFDFKKYHRDADGETFVIYGFTGSGRWVIVNVKSPGPTWGSPGKRTVDMKYVEDLSSLLEGEYALHPFHDIIEKLSEIVKRNAKRRAKLFQEAQKLESRIEFEDELLQNIVLN